MQGISLFHSCLRGRVMPGSAEGAGRSSPRGSMEAMYRRHPGIRLSGRPKGNEAHRPGSAGTSTSLRLREKASAAAHPASCPSRLSLSSGSSCRSVQREKPLGLRIAPRSRSWPCRRPPTVSGWSDLACDGNPKVVRPLRRRSARHLQLSRLRPTIISEPIPRVAMLRSRRLPHRGQLPD